MSVQDLVAPYYPVTPTSIIVVGAVLPALASTAVALRFRIKLQRRTGIGLDDWLILFSLILTIGVGIMMIVGKPFKVLFKRIIGRYELLSNKKFQKIKVLRYML
jgi:hypothetical protein